MLLQTGRQGVEKVIENLDKLGFFEAPASTRFHLSVKGGLVEHSVSVCRTAVKLRELAIAEKPELEARLPLESVMLAALLHDVCKAEISVIRLLQWGINLTMDEILAIRWHMNAWDLPFQSYEAMGNINAAKDKCPLLTILQAADMMSSMIYEG